MTLLELKVEGWYELLTKNHQNLLSQSKMKYGVHFYFLHLVVENSRKRTTFRKSLVAGIHVEIFQIFFGMVDCDD